jgi:hypothetical protein
MPYVEFEPTTTEAEFERSTSTALLLNPQDNKTLENRSMFLRNVDILLPDYTASQTEYSILHRDHLRISKPLKIHSIL